MTGIIDICYNTNSTGTTAVVKVDPILRNAGNDREMWKLSHSQGMKKALAVPSRLLMILHNSLFLNPKFPDIENLEPWNLERRDSEGKEWGTCLNSCKHDQALIEAGRMASIAEVKIRLTTHRSYDGKLIEVFVSIRRNREHLFRFWLLFTEDGTRFYEITSISRTAIAAQFSKK